MGPWEAVVFVGTVTSTVGYGNVVPKTNEGKALVIAAGLIGIPWTFAELTWLGLLMHRLIKRAVGRCLGRCLGACAARPRVLICVELVLALGYYAHCVAVYCVMEEWQVLDAAYYTFVGAQPGTRARRRLAPAPRPTVSVLWL